MNIQTIENEIAKLPQADLVKFRSWFEKFDQNSWDKQLETDIKSGKLDNLAKQAINDFNNGKFKKI